MDGTQRLDVWLERMILCLIGGALGFAILAFGGVQPRDFLVVEAMVVLALVLWWFRVLLGNGNRLLWPPVCWAVLAWAAFAIWRTQTADIEYIARGELMRILTYTALFFITLNNLHRQDTAQGLTMWIIAIATVLCFYGAWQFATSNNTVWGFARSANYFHRASGSYLCPNHFAGLLAILLPTALSSMLVGRLKPVTRIFLGYAVLVMLAGVALTFSRGGWLATGVGLGFVLMALTRHRAYRWAALICLGVLLLGAGIVATRSQGMKQRLQHSHDLTPESRNSRPNIWRAAIAMWRDEPWLGVGPAHFTERFKQYRSFRAHGEPERAHNDYLDLLTDWGVAGAAVMSSLWILLGYGVLRTLRNVRRDSGDLEVKRSGRYAFVLGACGGLLALLTHSLVDFNFHIPANAMVAVTWMALLAGYSRYATDNWWVSSRVPWRIGLTLVLVLPLAGFLGWDLYRRGREVRHLEEARLAAGGRQVTRQLVNTRMEALRAAWAVEPNNPWTAGQLGELHLQVSRAGGPDSEAQALEAIQWFNAAVQLNPYNPTFRCGIGMCLDWLEKYDEADAVFQGARRLDPEGRITSFYMGWHEMQKGNTSAARNWFNTSVTQGWPPFQPALDYLAILDRLGASSPVPPVTPPAESPPAQP